MSAPEQMNGGERDCRIDVAVEAAPFDAGVEIARLTEGRGTIGGVVSFVGLCRDEGGALAGLEIEHYPGMAETAIVRVAEAAARRFPVLALTIRHRFGTIRLGEGIVLVVAAGAHRRAAFEAADFLMDYLKSRAPFWKREIRADGTRGEWIAAKAADEDDLARWDGPRKEGA